MAWIPALVLAADWFKSFGSSGNAEVVQAVVVDTSFNTYVTGYFTGSFILGTTILASKGGKDVFLAKYDNTGESIYAYIVIAAESI